MLETADLDRRWGDFHDRRRRSCRALGALEPLDRARRGPRVLRALRRASRASRRARATRRPGYVKAMREIQRLPAGGALHPHDPRRPRRRALGPQAELGPARRSRRRPSSWRSRVIRGRAQAALPRLLHGGQVRGPGARHRGRAAADLRVHRARLRPGDARLPRDAPSSGCRRRRARCRAPQRRGAVGREAPLPEPREDVRAAEPGADRRLESSG